MSESSMLKNPNTSELKLSILLLRGRYDLKTLGVSILGILANIFILDSPVGFGWAIFHAMAVLLVGWFNPVLFKDLRGTILWGLMLGLTVSILYQPNPLTIIMSDIGWILLMIQGCQLSLKQPLYILAQIFLWGVIGWTRYFIDLTRMLRIIQAGSGRFMRQVKGFIPILLMILFFFLFVQANPIMAKWVDWIDWEMIKEWFRLHRLLFFAWISVTAWIVIRPKGFQINRQLFGLESQGAVSQIEKCLESLGNCLFSLNSLILTLFAFNALFALQNGMDFLFLWSGQVLPDGLTYADYAHRGAYPLILTALLAGGFVLFVLQPGSEREANFTLGTLVMLWLGQNILLTLSSIWRLALYVDAYSLTHLRVASFIWMGLVMVGLMLLLVRVAKRLDNLWLIRQNLIMLGMTLYLCSFVNWNFLIATVNVQTSLEYRGSGPSLDWNYINQELGEDSILATQAFITLSQKRRLTQAVAEKVKTSWQINTNLLNKNLQQDWRGWTLNRAWLSKSLISEKEILSLSTHNEQTEDKTEARQIEYNQGASFHQQYPNQSSDEDWQSRQGD